MSDHLTLRRGDGYAELVMDHAAKLNAMTPEFFRRLPNVLAELDADPDVGAVILTGSGRAFSAGADIACFNELTDTARCRAHLRTVFDAFHAVERAATPVIAAVNGLAFGGGTEILLACDVVLAATSATFSFREVTVGLTPGFGVVRAPSVIGRSWARRLVITGETLDAATSQRIGLVQEVFPGEELLPRARETATRLAQHPRLAMAVGKQLANHGTETGLEQAVEATALLFTTEEHRTAVRQFLDR